MPNNTNTNDNNNITTNNDGCAYFAADVSSDHSAAESHPTQGGGTTHASQGRTANAIATTPGGDADGFHFHLVRPHIPDPEFDWATADMSRSMFRYTDPAVQREFERFTHRDIASLVVGLIWTAGAVAYTVIYPDAFPTPVEEMMRAMAALNFVAVAIDVWLLCQGEFTASKARGRWWLCVVYGLGLFVISGVNLAWFNANCESVPNYLAPAADIMQPDLRNRRHDCIDVVNAYVVLPLLAGWVNFRFHPAMIGVLCVVQLVSYYSGYGLRPNYTDHGETFAQASLKASIYVFAAALATAGSVLRYQLMRMQFEQTLRAVGHAALTKRRTEDVDSLLVAMLPPSALDRLINGKRVHDWTSSASVLFSDMKDFTAWSAVRTPAAVVSMLNTLCRDFDALAAVSGVEKIKTIGDAYWCACGLPEVVYDHSERLCRFAVEMQRIVARNCARHSSWQQVALRIGVESGPLSGAVFGTSRLSYEVYGATSDVAAACEARGVPGYVCIGPICADALPVSLRTTPHVSVVLDDHVTQLHLLTDCANGADLVSTQYDTDSTVDSVAALALQQRAAERALERRLFVEARAARKQQLHANHESLDALEARFSARRYNWVLMRFDDDDIEAAYNVFVTNVHMPARRMTRVATLIFFALQCTIIGVEGSSINPARLVLLACTGALATGVIVGAYVGLPPAVDAAAMFAVMLLDIVAVALAPHSLAGNDTVYVFMVFIFLIGVGVTALPSAAIIVLLNVVGLTPILYFTWSSLIFLSNVMFCSFGVFFGGLVVVITERLHRRQFVEHCVCASHAATLEARACEQSALLESLVPDFVIPPLQTWLASDMDPNRAIVQHFDSAVVGFICLTRPEFTPSDGNVAPAESTSFSSRVGHHHDAAVAAAATSPSPVCDRFTALLSDVEDNAPHVAPGDCWLIAAHELVDEVLAAFPAVTKIKTIGATVMFAGSFDDLYSTSDACHAALDLIAQLHDALPLRAGLHVGEVLGAVLGTQRLCFDVFGDCVNVASRTLDVAPRAVCTSVTDEFFQTLQGSRGFGDGVAFTPLCSREAKGRGALAVRDVVGFHTVASQTASPPFRPPDPGDDAGGQGLPTGL